MSLQSQGFKPWFMQRLTAFIIGFGVIALTGWLLCVPDVSFESWRELFSRPLVNISTVLFIYAVLYHAWVGMRDVIIDYVHNLFVRIAILIVITLVLFALGIWISMIMATIITL